MLVTRISIVKQNDDSSFFYTSDHEAIRNLGIIERSSNYKAIENGSRITVWDTVYFVKKVILEIYSDDNNNYGFSLNKHGECYPYNLKLTIIVE